MNSQAKEVYATSASLIFSGTVFLIVVKLNIMESSMLIKWFGIMFYCLGVALVIFQYVYNKLGD